MFLEFFDADNTVNKSITTLKASLAKSKWKNLSEQQKVIYINNKISYFNGLIKKRELELQKLDDIISKKQEMLDKVSNIVKAKEDLISEFQKTSASEGSFSCNYIFELSQRTN